MLVEKYHYKGFTNDEPLFIIVIIMKYGGLYVYWVVLFMLVFSLVSCSSSTNSMDESKISSDSETSDKKSATENIEMKKDLGNEDGAIPKSETMKESGPDKNTTTKRLEGFHQNLNRNLSKNGLELEKIYDASSPVESRIFEEYGSVFLTTATPPSDVMFTNENDVSTFQTNAGVAGAKIGGVKVELQPKALKALQNAVAEAKSIGLDITPRGGDEAARRNYEKTLKLWNSRFEPALKHWKSKGRLNDEQIEKLKSLPIKEQVKAVLELEEKGIYFNTFFNNSILYSVAAPGTSQHISMLAFDVTEFQNKEVRKILAKHGWFRTVQNDEPHFTFLGHEEKDLPKLGLKRVIKKDGEFWIPNI